MRRDQLQALDDTADAIGQLHSRLAELDVADLAEAAAVQRAAELLDAADEVLTRLYCDAAPVPVGDGTPDRSTDGVHARM
jgi:hypothetical protein